MSALQRAHEQLQAQAEPPDEIYDLARRKAAAMGVKLSVARFIDHGDVVWVVCVTTRRGKVTARVGIDAARAAMVGRDAWAALVTEAWRDALREVGLL